MKYATYDNQVIEVNVLEGPNENDFYRCEYKPFMALSDEGPSLISIYEKHLHETEIEAQEELVSLLSFELGQAEDKLERMRSQKDEQRKIQEQEI